MNHFYPKRIALLFIFFLFVPIVLAASANEKKDSDFKATARLTQELLPSSSTAPLSEVLPLGIKPGKKTLSEIQVSQQSVTAVSKKERESYEKVMKKFNSSSSAEKQIVLVQLGEQRHRLLVSILNQMIVIYQRLDYIISSMDESLLRLRVMYSKKGYPRMVSNFDSRFSELEKEQSSLASQSKWVASNLEKVKTSADISVSIKESKKDVSGLLQNLKSFLAKYSSLAHEVVSSSHT